MHNFNFHNSVAILAQAFFSFKLYVFAAWLMLAALAGDSAAEPPSAKRRKVAAKVLPRCFFAFEPASGSILGAFSVSECCALQNSADQVYWSVDRWVELARHFPVPREARQWCNTLIHLKPDVELHCRGLPVTIGGRVHDHFIDLAGTRFHMWPMPLDSIKLVGSGSLPCTLITDAKFARAAKLVPDLVRSCVERIYTPIGIRTAGTPRPGDISAPHSQSSFCLNMLLTGGRDVLAL